MTIATLRKVVISGICLLQAPAIEAAQADPSTLSVQVLPTQRTPVYVWPIMRLCRPDRDASAHVVGKLDQDVQFQVQRLEIPADPAHQSCSGASCAELLSREGCEKRTGILVGGEIDEEACSTTDSSLAGCHGQTLSRLRVFRIDLQSGQAVRGDYRYALCEDRKCGSDGASVEDTLAQLVSQLVHEPSLPSQISAPRATPASPEQCVFDAAAPQPAPVVVPATPTFPPAVIAYAYYTQYKQLGGNQPSREQAEADAQRRAEHFSDGVNLPAGPQHITKTVNSKYALLPGEQLVGNAPRIGKLQGFLTTPPDGAEFAALRTTAGQPKALVTLVLDHETKALSLYLIDGKGLHPVPSPTSCLAGSGESASCLQDAVTATLTLALGAPQSAPSAAPVADAQPRKRPLACLPFRERACSTMCAQSDPPKVAPPAPVVLETTPPLVNRPLRKWADGMLYGATGVALATAIGLTVADSSGGAVQLMNDQGDTALIGGLYRPAEWTAWGLTIALAVPTVLSIADRIGVKPAVSEIPIASQPQVTLPVPPQCPIHIIK